MDDTLSKTASRKGSAIGTTQTFMTAGGIFGTLIGGYVVLPNIPAKQTAMCMPVMLIASQVIFITGIKRINSKIKMLLAVICLTSIALVSIDANGTKFAEDEILSENSDTVYETDTATGHIVVRNENGMRRMYIGAGFQSATFTEEGAKEKPVFEYMKKYDTAFGLLPDAKAVLMIGGGAYSYPKHMIATKTVDIDVVEIDEQVTEIARKYFYLDEIIEKYDAKDRINLITEDGRVYLNQNKKKYDIVFNDAFSSDSPVKTLITKEACQKVKNALTDNGIYATNIIGKREGNGSVYIKSVLKTMKSVFKNVVIMTVHSDKINDAEKRQNHVILASDGPLENVPNTVDVDDTNGILLTDAYCPIDTIKIDSSTRD